MSAIKVQRILYGFETYLSQFYHDMLRYTTIQYDLVRTPR